MRGPIWSDLWVVRFANNNIFTLIIVVLILALLGQKGLIRREQNTPHTKLPSKNYEYSCYSERSAAE